MILSSKTLALGLLPLAGLLAPTQEPEQAQWDQKQLEAVTAGIQTQIEVLRGQSFRSPVRVELTDAEGLVRYAKGRIKQTEDAASLHADEMAMKHFGLLDPERNYLEETFAMLEEQVGGFYDPGSDSFYLMDRFSGGLAKIILAHELTHALDDQLYDIDGTLNRTAKTTDSELAYHSVVEGSGLGTMYAWMRAHNTEWTLDDLAGAQSLTGGLDDAPAAVWKPLLGSYWLGVAFLDKTDKWRSAQMAMKAPAVENVAVAFKSPPLSTEQVLHPEKYWSEELRDDPAKVTFNVGSLPEGWKEVAQDTLGEVFLALASTPQKEREAVDPTNPQAVMTIEFTNEAATGWGGDRMILIESDAGSLMLHSSVWDSPRDADEFEAAMRKIGTRLNALNATAKGGGGFEVQRLADLVQLTSWMGTSAEGVAQVRKAVTTKASPASSDDSSPR